MSIVEVCTIIITLLLLVIGIGIAFKARLFRIRRRNETLENIYEVLSEIKYMLQTNKKFNK